MERISNNGQQADGQPLELDAFVSFPVVLDTDGAIIYLGTLRQITPTGFWLKDADVHDCRDGHDTKEAYILSACRDGIPINRREVFVMRDKVLSISRLESVVTD
ncbi:MAG TPA: hypothetical protein VGM03_11970 [Phycisphaerae bacterium]